MLLQTTPGQDGASYNSEGSVSSQKHCLILEVASVFVDAAPHLSLLPVAHFIPESSLLLSKEEKKRKRLFMLLDHRLSGKLIATEHCSLV